MADNAIAAAALEGHYNSSSAQNGTIVIRFGDYSQPQNLSVSIEIAGLSPSIDDISCTTDGLALISARGYQMGHLVALPSEGYPDFYCDRQWYEGAKNFGWRCDFDEDYCFEYEDQAFVAYEMNATFTFRNVSASVPFSSTLTEIPEEVMEEMRGASGAENLTVGISGNATFIYQLDNQTFGFGDCSSNFSNVSQSVSFSANRTFVVGGEKKLFFLRAPVLREQWFRNNRFDTVVLSQCPLYHADIYMNGNITENFTLREFDVVTDSYGISWVLSNKTNATGSGWSESSSNVTTPFPLEHADDSFRFVYEFNHSYAGLGENNLSLVVRDVVLSPAQYNDSFTSRVLTFNGNITETGSPASAAARPSSGFAYDSLAYIRIGLGLIALVFILAFVNSWLVK
jgi:hypothetical protein